VGAPGRKAGLPQPRALAAIDRPSSTLGIHEILAGPSLRDKFDDPRLEIRARRTSSSRSIPQSSSPAASRSPRHGGFNEDDLHTALLVSHTHLDSLIVKTTISNQPVAATIVKALGADA
jgi:hypothetical protein